MQTFSPDHTLREMIADVESKRAEERRLLKEQLIEMYENLKPVNVLKNTLQDVVASQELKEKIAIVSVALLAGYLSRIIFQSTSKSPFKRLVGLLIQFAVTKAIADKPEFVRKIGQEALSTFKDEAS